MKNPQRKRRANSLDKTMDELIRARRLERHLSQTDLSRALNISFQQLQKYEIGTNWITVSRLLEVSKALKIDTAYFLGYEICAALRLFGSLTLPKLTAQLSSWEGLQCFAHYSCSLRSA